MKKLLALILLLALSGAVVADAIVPAGKAAVAEVVIGKATFASGKVEKPLTVGQALAFGDRVATGENGRIFLRLASQAVSRIAPNTEMTLDAPGKRQGTYLTLIKGWARFLVGQRSPGDAFEVGTHNAVAAVKGTDMEVGDDGQSHARVFDSEHHPALDFNDPKTGQGVELDAGQGADYDGSTFSKIADLQKELRHDEQLRYKGLPEPTPGVEAGQGAQAKDDKPLTEAQSEALDQVQQLMEDSVDKVLSDTQRDIKLDQQMDKDEHTNDLVASRMGIDQYGVPVQISHYVYRPAAHPDTVQLTTVNTRPAGSYHEGNTTAIETTQWNQALPFDWMSVARRGLNDPANIDPNTGWASYFKLNQTFLAMNPTEDELLVNTNYDQPFYVGGVGAGYPLYQTWAQVVATVTGHNTGGVTVGSVSAHNTATPLFAYIVSDDYLTLDQATGHYYDPYYSDVNSLLNGGELSVTSLDGLYTYYPYSYASLYGNTIQYYYGNADNNGSYLYANLQLLDSTGASVTPPSTGYWPGLGDFKGQDPSLNIEMELTWYNGTSSQYNFNSIDLLFMPAYFDVMTIMDFPQGSGG